MTRVCRALAIGLMAAWPCIAAAQTAPPTAATRADRIEIEGYGSIARLFDAGEAALTLPDAGAPIATSSPFFPSRRVPSWFFGDGAALLNSVNEQLGLSARITPLDAVIATIGRGAQSGSGGGARLRIRTAPRVWMELGLDVSGSAEPVPNSLLTAVQETRGSFVQAMTSLFASGPFTGTNVTATASLPSAHWRDVTATLSANIDLEPIAGLRPFLTLGGGIVTRVGSQPEVTLEGRYRARILGAVPIDETDRVTVRSQASTAPVLVLGGGLSRSFSEHISVRLDARLIAANRTIGASLDATPTVATGTPADFIESFTNPAVQFSNNAATGRRSTLSGDALDHIDVARSTRLQTRGVMTLGLALRF